MVPFPVLIGKLLGSNIASRTEFNIKERVVIYCVYYQLPCHRELIRKLLEAKYI